MEMKFVLRHGSVGAATVIVLGLALKAGYDVQSSILFCMGVGALMGIHGGCCGD
jgi:hypothetical protein